MRTYAIYMRPRGTDQAVRHRDYLTPFSSAKEARQVRRRLGPDACIHCADDGNHPDPLPFGETLWLEKQRD